MTWDAFRGVDTAHLILSQQAITLGFSRLSFNESDISLIACDTACLNDTCINGCATLLYSTFSITTPKTAAQCALLSTFDLDRIRDGLPDPELWRSVGRTAYWQKDIWLVPIHRGSRYAGHWVLCVVNLRNNRMVLFDSLAEQTGWKRDVAVS